MKAMFAWVVVLLLVQFKFTQSGAFMQNAYSAYRQLLIIMLGLMLGLTLNPTLVKAEPASAASIREYFKISGQEVAAKENIAKMLPQLREVAKDLPDALFTELTNTDRLVDKMIPTYQKYLSEREVQDLIAFYKTPTGIQFATIYPKMEAELVSKLVLEAQMTIANYYIQNGHFTVDKK
jgi:uncharacterized protein